MTKHTLCLVIIISIFLNFNIYGKTKTSKDAPGTAIFVMAEVDSQPVHLETMEFNYQSPEINLNIKIPQIKGLTDKKYEKILNKGFVAEAEKARDLAITTAKAYNKDLGKDKLTLIKFEYISSYSIIETPKPYLVIGFLEYQYSGGAHGISHQSYLTIDTYKNHTLSFKDLFKENTDYISAINEEIKSQMRAREARGDYFFTGVNGFMSINENQTYYINKNGDIVIVFNIYEIAPYAAGIIEFPIPREKLLPYLK